MQQTEVVFYKVKSLSVSGLNNKIHRAGDLVKSTDFPPGHAEKLLHQKHLEETSFQKVSAVDEQETAPVVDRIEDPAADVADTTADKVETPEKETAETSAPQQEETEEVQELKVKHIVTQTDLDNNPSLTEQGVQLGDEIELPADEHLDMVREHYETFGLPTLREMCAAQGIEAASNAGKKKLVDLLMAKLQA